LDDLLAIGRLVFGVARRTLTEQDLTDPTLAVIGTNGVGHDREEPGVKGPIGLVLTRSLMNLDEDILKEVVPIGVRHAASDEVGVNRSAIPCDETGESFWVAFAVFQEEIALLDG
jgi:hypothetical protein